MTKGPIRILLVEDNIDELELMVTALTEKDASIKVTEAATGKAALKYLAETYYDLILLDYSLPDMTGIEVLEQIRARRLDSPVIMVTGQGAEPIAVEAMKQGAQDYIVKTGNYHEALPMSVEKTLELNRLKMELDEASLRSRRLYEILLSITKEQKIDALAEQFIVPRYSIKLRN